MKSYFSVALAATFVLGAAPAFAGLNPAIVLTGNVGLSVDGFGSNSAAGGQIQAFIPVGATIEKAYLYSAGLPNPAYSDAPTTAADYNAGGISLGGFAVTTFDTIVGAISTRPEIGRWYTGRADVTALVSSLVSGAVTTDFSFAVNEGSLNGLVDGEVLAIAYSLPTLAKGSVVFLDGGQATAGETTTVNFAAPLGDTTSPDFVAQLGLGISYSCCGQESSVSVNGTKITDFAGNNDDGDVVVDGSLITVGGLGDTAISSASSYEDDHELYNLSSYLNQGDSSFKIFTNNPTADDNIFFASLYTTATVGSVTAGVPEPASWAMMIGGLALAGGLMRRRKSVVSFA